MIFTSKFSNVWRYGWHKRNASSRIGVKHVTKSYDMDLGAGVESDEGLESCKVLMRRSIWLLHETSSGARREK